MLRVGTLFLYGNDYYGIEYYMRTALVTGSLVFFKLLGAIPSRKGSLDVLL